MKYRIKETFIVTAYSEIEAYSEDDAIDKLADGQGGSWVDELGSEYEYAFHEIDWDSLEPVGCEEIDDIN